MPYVRNHGNQLAIVHGERDPDTQQVQQRVLFTICSKPEALAALGEVEDHWHLDTLLENRFPRIRFDWEKIRAGIKERMDVLPDNYPYREGELIGRFRADLCAFTRQLGLADPRDTHAAAELLSSHRLELEYLRELIDWRLAVCKQERNEWNGDNAFFWRRRLEPGDVPHELLEHISELQRTGDLDRLEAVARLFIDCYEDYADGHNYLGFVAQERGDLEGAIAHYQRAVTVGRKLFPKRLAKKHYWNDHDTRPYMRGLRSTAIALWRLARYDEALAVCERLEQECDDTIAGITFRAHIYLNMGRWQEAGDFAKRVVGLWPEHAYLVAFALLEQGKRRDALGWFLHGVLTLPRTGRMLLGLRNSKPENSHQARDHNTGVAEMQNLEAFLHGLKRPSRAFFKGILNAAATRALVTEMEENRKQWHEQRSAPDRGAYDRMRQMASLEFAFEAAGDVWREIEG